MVNFISTTATLHTTSPLSRSRCLVLAVSFLSVYSSRFASIGSAVRLRYVFVAPYHRLVILGLYPLDYVSAWTFARRTLGTVIEGEFWHLF